MCLQISWLVPVWYDVLLKGVTEETIVTLGLARQTGGGVAVRYKIMFDVNR